jgi:hypothetical protein
MCSDVHVRVRWTSKHVRRPHGRRPSARRMARPSATAIGRPPTVGRGGRPAVARAVLQGRPTEVDGCLVRLRTSAIAVRLRRSFGAVRLHRLLSMTPISPFYTMCLLL